MARILKFVCGASVKVRTVCIHGPWGLTTLPIATTIEPPSFVSYANNLLYLFSLCSSVATTELWWSNTRDLNQLNFIIK